MAMVLSSISLQYLELLWSKVKTEHYMGFYDFQVLNHIPKQFIEVIYIRNFLTYLNTLSGPESFDIFKGHSKATMFLVCNNAAQGILSSFFFKYAGIIFGLYITFLSFKKDDRISYILYKTN